MNPSLNTEPKRALYILGGLSGVAGTCCYILSIALYLNNVILYLLAMVWPILSIIFAFALFHYVSLERQTVANYLAFIFACLGFTLLAAMISVQLAVKMGVEEFIAGSTERNEMLGLIERTIRLIDQGIDVAWDLFIGSSLLFLAFALKGHTRFRLYWSIPAALLGFLLILFNLKTFPWPPDTQGLIDVGPFIGIYIIALGFRLLWLGIRFKNQAVKPDNS